MTAIANIGKLAIAGALTVAMTTPSLAEWVVVKVGDICNVVEESVAGDEIRVAGPFATQEEADNAKAERQECITDADRG